MNRYSTYHTLWYGTYMFTFVCQAETEIFSTILCINVFQIINE